MTAERFLEIHKLLADYCIAIDDLDRFMDCWVSTKEFGGFDYGPFGEMETLGRQKP